MYKSIRIQNFRAFEDVTVEPLARVNLISGKNNAGKTTLMEALWISSGPSDLRIIPAINEFRRNIEPDSLDKFLSVFRMFDPENHIKFSVNGDWGESPRKLRIRLEDSDTVPMDGTLPNSAYGKNGNKRRIVFRYTDDMGTESETSGDIHGESETLSAVRSDPIERGMPSAVYLSANPIINLHRENARRFSKLRRDGKHGKIEDMLRRVEPRLSSIFVDAVGGQPRLFAEIKGYENPVPTALLGDGAIRILNLALAMADSSGGALMVDEIENGIHHSSMEPVWDGIDELSQEFDVQLFATTQSWECCYDAQQAFFKNEMAEDFRYHRIDRRSDTGEVSALTYSPESLEASFEIPLEIRGAGL